jgi:hypothetical protein
MSDPRIMLTQPLENWPEAKNQVIDMEEYTKLWPRGSTGNNLVEGSSVIYFDYPANMVILSSPHNRFDITVKIEKKTGSGGWVRLQETDAKHLVLAENFISHAFSKIEFQVNHMPTTTDGFIKNGQGLYETFLLSHTKDDAKLFCITSDKDPAYHTYLKKTDWAPQSGTATNKWTEYFSSISGERTFNVNYRPYCFPFQLAPPTEDKTYIVPSMGQQLTTALYLDTTYQNVFTVHNEPAPAAAASGATAEQKAAAQTAIDAWKAALVEFRFSITNIELNVVYARMSALGERALLDKPRAALAQYPGMYVKQYPMFNSKGDKQAIFNVPDIALPSHVLVQSYDPDVLAAGKAPSSSFRTRALDLRLSEVLFKLDDQVFYISPINPTKIGAKDLDMTTLRRRSFFQKPFFRMPCHPDIAKGEIKDYSHPHLLYSLSNGANGPAQTINAGPDPRKGKFSIHFKSNDELGLQPFYLLTFVYDECGVIIDRQNKSFVSSYFAL